VQEDFGAGQGNLRALLSGGEPLNLEVLGRVQRT
jgi:hypothetical protein